MVSFRTRLESSRTVLATDRAPSACTMSQPNFRQKRQRDPYLHVWYWTCTNRRTNSWYMRNPAIYSRNLFYRIILLHTTVVFWISWIVSFFVCLYCDCCLIVLICWIGVPICPTSLIYGLVLEQSQGVLPSAYCWHCWPN